jgi:DNA repair protein RecO (recombination protein O)
MLIKAEGIVIRTTDYGETNKIVTLYTREQGKVGVMARGAKKPRSKLAASGQLLTYGQYLYTIGKGLGTLQQGDIENPFRYIKADIFKMAYATYIVDFVDKMPISDVRNPYLFEFVLQLLTYIDEGVHPQVLSLIFDVKMLPILGVEPQTSHCIQCQSTTGPFKFSISGGGILCLRCSASDPRAIPVSGTFLKLINLFKRMDVAHLGKIDLKQETINELNKVLSAYYDAYSGLNLKSKRFIQQLEGIDTFKPKE